MFSFVCVYFRFPITNYPITILSDNGLSEQDEPNISEGEDEIEQVSINFYLEKKIFSKALFLSSHFQNTSFTFDYYYTCE